MADPISALKQELIRINSLGDDAILAALENPEKGLVSLRRALKDVDSFLTGTTQRHPSPYTSEAKAILEGGVVDWHLADGGVSRVAVSSGGKTGSPTLRLDEGLSSPRVIKNWSIAVPERKRPPVRVYEVPKSASTSPAVSHSSRPPSPGGREFKGVSPQVVDKVRGLPPKNRKKMSVRDHYQVVFGSGSDVDKTKTQMVEELMDFIQDTQGDFRGDAAAAQEWSRKSLSADTRNKLLSAWQGVRTERNFLGFRAGQATKAGRLDSVEKFRKQFEYFDDFASEFSGQSMVSGVRREVRVDVDDILRGMPEEELSELGVTRFGSTPTPTPTPKPPGVVGKSKKKRNALRAYKRAIDSGDLQEAKHQLDIFQSLQGTDAPPSPKPPPGAAMAKPPPKSTFPAPALSESGADIPAQRYDAFKKDARRALIDAADQLKYAYDGDSAAALGRAYVHLEEAAKAGRYPGDLAELRSMADDLLSQVSQEEWKRIEEIAYSSTSGREKKAAMSLIDASLLHGASAPSGAKVGAQFAGKSLRFGGGGGDIAKPPGASMAYPSDPSAVENLKRSLPAEYATMSPADKVRVLRAKMADLWEKGGIPHQRDPDFPSRILADPVAQPEWEEVVRRAESGGPWSGDPVAKAYRTQYTGALRELERVAGMGGFGEVSDEEFVRQAEAALARFEAVKATPGDIARGTSMAKPPPKPPQASILSSPEGQRVLRDMSKDEARELYRNLSEEWTDRRGRPRSPREIKAAEAWVLKKAARYGTWEPDLVDPFDPQPPRQPVKTLPGVPEGTLADPRPPLGSETWEGHSGGSPKEEFARKATRWGFEEAAELGSKLPAPGSQAGLLTPPRFDDQTGEKTPYGRFLEERAVMAQPADPNDPRRGVGPSRVIDPKDARLRGRQMKFSPEEMYKMDELSKRHAVPDYPYYVVSERGKVYSGWESAEDARDALRELRGESAGVDAKVQSAVGFERQRGRRPLGDDWMDNEELVGKIREGQYGRPPVRTHAVKPILRSIMSEMPEYSLLNSQGAQELIRDADPEEQNRVVRELSNTWTDEFGEPNSPGEVERAERMVLEELAESSRMALSEGVGQTGRAAGSRVAKVGIGELAGKLLKGLAGGIAGEVIGEVVFPMEAEAAGVTHEDPFEYGYYPRHLSPEQGKKWRERQEEAERLKNDPVFQGLMPDPATGRMAAAEFGSAPTKTPPRPVEDPDLVGGMPGYSQRPVFD